MISQTFSRYVKDKKETQQISTVFNAFVILGLVGIIIPTLLVEYDVILAEYYNTLLSPIFYPLVFFYLVIEWLLVKYLFLQNQDASGSIVSRFRDIKEKGNAIGKFNMVAVVIFHITALLQILLQSQWWIGITRDLSLLFLLSSLYYNNKQEKDAPHAFMWVILLQLLLFCILAFQAYYISAVEGLDNGITSIKALPFIMFLILPMVMVVWGEEETIQSVKFKKYEDEFANYDEGLPTLTGFIGKTPAKLAKMRSYLNAMYLFIIFFGIILVLLISNNTIIFESTNDALFTILLMSTILLGIIIFTYKTRNQLFDIIGDYGDMLEAFTQRNQRLLDLMQPEELEPHSR